MRLFLKKFFFQKLQVFSKKNYLRFLSLRAKYQNNEGGPFGNEKSAKNRIVPKKSTGTLQTGTVSQMHEKIFS